MIKEIIFIVFCIALPAAAQAWSGTVLSVHDGDTLTVAPCGDVETPVAIRLYGIHAPEDDQPGGDASTAYLSALLPIGAAVEIIPFDVDRYGRSVALVVHEGRPLNGEMVGAGLAWVYPRYCRAAFCKPWTRRQHEARASGLGLWSDPKPLPPWEWRSQVR